MLMLLLVCSVGVEFQAVIVFVGGRAASLGGVIFPFVRTICVGYACVSSCTL